LTNALGVILGNVELAKEEMSAEYLDEIREAALRARDLIRQPVPEQRATAPSVARKTAARLMCVDDDEAFLLLASRALQRLGHQARTFSSPDEALREFSRRPGDWDLIVMDNNLLGREGLEIASEFLYEEPRARICIASGAVDEVLRTRAEKAGIYRVILKPGTMSEFADLIQGMLAELTPPPDPL
jgi:CheY-like chemotaxis protein